MSLSKQDFIIKRNDTLPNLQLSLTTKGNLGETIAFNLSAVTATTFTMVDDCGNAKVISATATISDSDCGLIYYSWQTGDTDTSGTYKGEFTLFFQDGKKITVPRSSVINIHIEDDINPYN